MPENKVEVYEVTHSSPELKTVGDYILDPSSPAHKYADNLNTRNSFLNVKNKIGKTNREVIEARLNKYEKKYKGSNADELPLKVGTILAIPKFKIDQIGLLTQGIQVVSNNIPAFKARALAQLETEIGYRPVSSYRPVRGKLTQGGLKEEYPDTTVWIWCRALSETGENKGQIFNITPFVSKLNTNVGKNGGNFQISVAPLVCELNERGQWTIKRNSLKKYKNNNYTSLQNSGYLAEASILKTSLEQPDPNKASDNVLKRQQFLFHNIITPNDMVWIRYETLDMEKEQRIEDNSDFYIDKSKIAGRVYDMIGLVDSNTITVNPDNNDVSISIVGRDLSKLFIEDGTYFYPLEMSQGKLNFAGGSTAENELMQRVFSDNALQFLNTWLNNSIEQVLKFIIQQLSTIKVVPDDLFTSYVDSNGVDRRNKKFNQHKNQQKQGKAANDQLEDLRKEIRERVSINRVQTKVALGNHRAEQLRINIVYQACIDFMKEVRDSKKRKLVGNKTIGWTSFVSKISNFSSKAEEDCLPNNLYTELPLRFFFRSSTTSARTDEELIGLIDQYLDIKYGQPKYKELWTEDPANGIWQIIKLVIDDGVTERRICDSSISSANGSLLNFVRKICQEPFVEFYMDTYGDMYHLIVRKPPYDKVGIESMLSGRVRVDTNKDGKKDKTIASVIDIEPEDVLQEQLSYDDQSAITWYHLTPQANFFGSTSTYSLAYLPAIFFKEYAEIWGSKPMQLTHNYMPRLPLNPQESTLDISEKQAFEDYRYMIESNAYLPFTRKGSITLNGDRRLKLGNIVRYKSTGEIFFIDHVQQQFSINDSTIDRTTTIQVSRGMREVLIEGVLAPEKGGEKQNIFSYFNIINTKLALEKRESQTVITERVEVGTRTVETVIPSATRSTTTTTTKAPTIKTVAPGFEEYLQHQQGPTGAKIIIKAASTNSDTPLPILRNMKFNVGRDFNKTLTARNFLEYWIDKYNKRYSEAQRNLSQYETYYQTIAQEQGVRVDVLRTFGLIESTHRNLGPNAGGYTGVMQLSNSEAARFNVVINDPLDNIRGGAKLIKENAKNKLSVTNQFEKASTKLTVNATTITTLSTQTVTSFEPIFENKTSVQTVREVDRDKVFSNFKVYKDCFNFFLRRKENDDSLKSILLDTIVVTAGDEVASNINELNEEQLKQLSQKISNKTY